MPVYTGNHYLNFPVSVITGYYHQFSFVNGTGRPDTPNIIANHSHYIGLTENTFKDRFYKHKNSFKYESERNTTKLSNFVWEKKHANTETNPRWNILDKARAYKPETKRCLLCLTENYHIIFSKLNLLNSRNELVTKCCHGNKFYLANFKESIT